MNQTFHEWLENHRCSVEELWKIQNCLGSVLGFENPIAKDAEEAWRKQRYPSP